MTPELHNTISRSASRTMYLLCIILTATIVSILILVTAYLVYSGVGQLGIHLFTHLPGDNPPGMKNSIVGTVILIAMASALGIPIGLLSGVYLAEYDRGSRLVAPLRFVCDVLAGVPSVVVGVLGYVLLVKPIGHNNGWAGAMALAFIMIPIVARTTEEMLRLVPYSYREASIALGATKAITILTVVLPSATGSVATGIMLAVARVAGETAPLIFTAGLSSYMQFNPSQPFPSMTAQIYDFRTDPSPDIRSLAFTGMMVLVFLIFALNLAIRFVTRKHRAMG
ncbi:MAG: phosphate ABC transporter permease PstA [Phycisphaerae bacterium]|nr:phosphate ABC transporter permease PstA [Phycisphaerae bacterium]